MAGDRPGNDASGLTHPDRVLYPRAGITKRDLADYVEAVAEPLLAAVAGRPLGLLRCPEGIDDDCFFQKHPSAGMDAVRSVRLAEAGGGEDDYIVVDDREGLLELVQFNALEFHPWGARADDPEHCDRLVIDLDPGPGVDWEEVRRAARLVREALGEAGLESFVRTTGGKGLHVVAPLSPPSPWDAAHDWSRDLARDFAAREPGCFVATASKAARHGRIFIDWLRNTRGNSAIASWSPRARAGAPVAMPLRWDELDRVEAANAWDIAAARRRLAALDRDPWEGIASARQGLPESRG